MPRITLEHITKRWGKFYAVDNLDLTIGDNEFVTLLGPSGCGKTTILRMIAGLETPTSGLITIGDTVVFDSESGINVPANRRKVGFLFQSYALWPNMTVRENIAFGLENVKEALPKVDFEARNAARLAEILSLPDEAAHICSIYDAKSAVDRLAEAFVISGATAKKLYSHVKSGKNLSVVAARLKEAAEKARAQKNLNDRYEYTRDGEVLKEVRKLTKEEIDVTVRRVAKVVKIGMFLDRYPAELSGGQQQRVAIARTLAPEPSVLFMDEPLSNLDAKLRLEMRYELQRLHVETGSTFVYVTHDQMEAMTLATRICLLNNGVLQQYAAPLTIYHQPENTFVADFVGNPSINFVPASGAQRGGTIALEVFGRSAAFVPNAPLDLGSWISERDRTAAERASEESARSATKEYVEKGNKDEVFRVPFAMLDEAPVPDGEFLLGIRPEFISISQGGALDGEIYGSMPTGMESTIKLRVGDLLLTGVVFGSSAFCIGEKVKASITGTNVLLFDRASGKKISEGSLNFDG